MLLLDLADFEVQPPADMPGDAVPDIHIEVHRLLFAGDQGKNVELGERVPLSPVGEGTDLVERMAVLLDGRAARQNNKGKDTHAVPLRLAIVGAGTGGV